MHPKLISPLVMLILAMLCAAPAAALNAADPALLVETRVREKIPEARLSGEGSLRMLGFHIYDARLFVGPQGIGDGPATDRPYALDLRYARDFKGVAIAKRTRKEMERLGMGDDDRRRGWEQTLASIFPDVRQGDHLTGIYRPEGYTLFLRNGAPIGRVDGAEFARAFFSIWLHPESSAPDVRAALLGRTDSR